MAEVLSRLIAPITNSIAAYKDPEKLERIKDLDLRTFLHEKIQLEPIAQVVTAFEEVLPELVPHLRVNAYDMLIGDDVSGRIPTLIVRGLIRGITNGQPLPTFFVSGIHGGLFPAQKELLQKQIAPLMSDRDRERDYEALIVTDYIQSGYTIKSIGDELHHLGVIYDVLAVSAYHDQRFYERNKTIRRGLQEKIMAGKTLHLAPTIWGKHTLAGVTATKEEKVQLYPDERQRAVQARKDVQRAITRLVRLSQQYLSTE